MAENEDPVARYSAERANERITEHIETCAQHYAQISKNFEKNTEDHKEIRNFLNEIREDLHRYDMRAVIRWIAFGGAFLLLIAGALLRMWGKM